MRLNLSGPEVLTHAYNGMNDKAKAFIFCILLSFYLLIFLPPQPNVCEHCSRARQLRGDP